MLRWFANLKVAHKLALGFGLVLLLLIGTLVAELERCAGSQFDPRVVEAFLRALDVQEQLAEHRQVDEPQPNVSTSMGGQTTLA